MTISIDVGKTRLVAVIEFNSFKAIRDSVLTGSNRRYDQDKCDWWKQKLGKGFYDPLKNVVLRNEVFWGAYYGVVIRWSWHFCALWHCYFWMADEIREGKEQLAWIDSEKRGFYLD